MNIPVDNITSKSHCILNQFPRQQKTHCFLDIFSSEGRTISLKTSVGRFSEKCTQILVRLLRMTTVWNSMPFLENTTWRSCLCRLNNFYAPHSCWNLISVWRFVLLCFLCTFSFWGMLGHCRWWSYQAGVERSDQQ